MGCGRVGASLARAIERAGHEVAVIDQDESAFRRLGTTFEGRTITGVGFDRDHRQDPHVRCQSKEDSGEGIDGTCEEQKEAAAGNV